jgi:chloramphenicol O-acetyltransferase type A
MFQPVDLNQWPRRTTYEFFKDYEDPFFNFGANVDVSHLYRFCKTNGLTVSLTLLYYSLVTANDIREFRIRLVNGQLVEFDKIHATQTILNDDETFSFAYFEMKDDVFRFNESGIRARERYKALRSFDVESHRADLIYFSAIPWVSFTSFKHASQLDKSQTIPRIVFGKIFTDGDRMLMPLSVEANHMIMDGIHVGKFFNGFQENLNSATAL